MTDESRGSQDTQRGPANAGRRTFLRDGLSLVGGAALASVALDVLPRPRTGVGRATDAAAAHLTPDLPRRSAPGPTERPARARGQP